jgi:hypothetical protein
MSVIYTIKHRCQRLKEGYQSPGGWRSVIDNEDSDNLYSESDQFCLQWHCRYLAMALLLLALVHLSPGKFTWENCCELAIGTVNHRENHMIDSGIEWQLQDGRVSSNSTAL